MKVQMQIVFDNIVFSLQRSGGISVVWYELLTRIQQSYHLSPLFIENKKAQNHLRQQMHFDTESIIGNIRFPNISRYGDVSVPLSKPFIFHSSYYRCCNNPQAINITTVHDFTYEFYRKGLQKRIHSWQKFKAIHHSDYIVCVSENTKRDLLTLLPDVDKRKVRVIHNGVSDDYYRLDSSVIKDDGLPFPTFSYVLYVGDRSEYKNFSLCVNGVSQTDYHLVIVGKELTKAEDTFMKQRLPKERYHATGFVTNKRLNQLFNHAAALVYPSAYEGFGIPVLEAQKAGCPVIACNTSSITEVLASETLMMKEISVRELISKLKLLSDNALMQEVRQTGIEYARRFSWKKMANQYFDLYQEASLNNKEQL